MSVVKILRGRSAVATAEYVAYGDKEHFVSGEVRADILSVVSSVGDDPVLAATKMADDVATYGRGKRTTEVLHIIQSFSPDEISINDSAGVAKAHQAALDLAEKIAPSCEVIIATHTDAEGGHVHNHIVVSNHDLSSHKSAPRAVQHWHSLTRHNDEVMKALDLEIVPRRSVRKTQAEYRAEKAGKSTKPVWDSADLTAENWANSLRVRIDALLENDSVVGCDSVDDALAKMVEIAPDYGMSFWTRGVDGTNKRERSSFALLDADGEPVKVPGKKAFSASIAGNKLGEKYKIKHLRNSLAAGIEARRAKDAVERQTQMKKPAIVPEPVQPVFKPEPARVSKPVSADWKQGFGTGRGASHTPSPQRGFRDFGL